MTAPTDKTIEIECPECSVIRTGRQAMFVHIRAQHPQYSPPEAEDYADAWMENAYEAYEENQRKLTEAYQHEKRHRAFWGK